ncbi:MAG: YtxH domain-containing protein [Chloroflexi bacterium]|nr:YtxH domain-containing protein [Chloroflexota bacterium]
MRRMFSFIFGAALGGLVGAVVALLWAPYSGEELRGEVRTRVATFQNELGEAVSSRRIELERQLAGMRKPKPTAAPEA